VKVLHDLHENPVKPINSTHEPGICGCCGARYVETTEDFNNLTEVALSEVWRDTVQLSAFNRGICIGRNIKEDEIEPADNSVIESFVVEGETFYVRIRQ
jgi:hypothetical protein